MNRLVSIAPMMECTDRHDRYFLRLLSPNVVLYTEMITMQAMMHGDVPSLLAFDHSEHPIALQVGGNDPQQLAQCAKMAEQMGYDEINLNVGCPSDRVRSGKFGACLMLQPNLVAECVAAMHQAVHIPVTVKCRIGVDDHDQYEDLYQFISQVHSAGCHIFIIHARKALLKGLSPKQNREIPPLRYDVAARIKKDFSQLTIIVNGGIKTIADIQTHLQIFDGVMIGREAYANPFLLHAIERDIFKNDQPLSREEAIEHLIPYIDLQLQSNVKLSSIARHILGLFHGEKNARRWRRHLSEEMHKQGAQSSVVAAALNAITSSRGLSTGSRNDEHFLDPAHKARDDVV